VTCEIARDADEIPRGQSTDRAPLSPVVSRPPAMAPPVGVLPSAGAGGIVTAFAIWAGPPGRPSPRASRTRGAWLHAVRHIWCAHGEGAGAWRGRGAARRIERLAGERRDPAPTKGPLLQQYPRLPATCRGALRCMVKVNVRWPSTSRGCLGREPMRDGPLRSLASYAAYVAASYRGPGGARGGAVVGSRVLRTREGPDCPCDSKDVVDGRVRVCDCETLTRD